MKDKPGHTVSRASLLQYRGFRLRPVLVVFILFALIFWTSKPNAAGKTYVVKYAPNALQGTWRRPEYVDNDLYDPFPVTGYAAMGIPDGGTCNKLQVAAQQLEVTQSIYLEDHILDLAETLVHPLIDYSGESSALSFRQKVAKTWGIMAGSSVWLEHYQVYFSVTRVFFYNQGVIQWPKISFLYAQIFDKSWKSLHNYTIDWEGSEITYPRILDIPIPYELGSGFWGPEDPRIIAQQSNDNDNAEPLIVFNMQALDTKFRGMYLHMPFSNHTTLLRIEGHEPRQTEKNWAPFIMPLRYSRRNLPTKHIHFIYEWHPLIILRCHVLNGICQEIYSQEKPSPPWNAYNEQHKHNDTHGVMRGGTNFEILPLSPAPGLTSFIGFPRTHTDAGCGVHPIYRPVLMVLTANHNGTLFWFDYASDAIDFGMSVLTREQYNSVCDKGRILLTNSIARFDVKHDILTMTFSVADSTVQVAKIRGIRNLIEHLPNFGWNETAEWHEKALDWKLNVTSDVLICGIQSASDYAYRYENVTDRLSTPMRYLPGSSPEELALGFHEAHKDVKHSN